MLRGEVGMKVSAEDTELWSEVKRLLSHHQKNSDQTPLAALNRIFREFHAERTDLQDISSENCQIRSSALTWKQAANLERKDTNASNPRYSGDPVVAVEFEGKTYVVDGRRRVNRLVSNKCQNPLPTLIISCDAYSTSKQPT